jgi:3-oxoacyl-ACP reductase-like protein
MDADQERRLNELEQQQSYQAPPPQYQPAPAPAAAAPAAASSPMVDQLNQLATLHQQGVLSDEEFTAAKAKLFGS